MCAAVALAAAIVALRTLRDARDGAGDSRGRAEFMAFAGLLGALLFGLLILLTGLPLLSLDACPI